jgi:hypothetical protein
MSNEVPRKIGTSLLNDGGEIISFLILQFIRKRKKKSFRWYYNPDNYKLLFHIRHFSQVLKLVDDKT